MQVDMPFYEGPEDALKAAVSALGGSKKVGPMLWPDKTIDQASRLLLDCLNPGRAEKLDITQVMFILARAKDVGCYAPFVWLAGEVGFDAHPITRAEEVDRVTSVIETASATLASAMSTLERLQRLRAVDMRVVGGAA
jgi:hypothetical protein